MLRLFSWFHLSKYKPQAVKLDTDGCFFITPSPICQVKATCKSTQRCSRIFQHVTTFFCSAKKMAFW